MFITLAIIAAQGVAVAFMPPLKLVVNAVGQLCPVDPDGYPDYNEDERSEDVGLYDTEHH